MKLKATTGQGQSLASPQKPAAGGELFNQPHPGDLGGPWAGHRGHRFCDRNTDMLAVTRSVGGCEGQVRGHRPHRNLRWVLSAFAMTVTRPLRPPMLPRIWRDGRGPVTRLS